MSKRARITLDPEPEEPDLNTGATSKPAPKAARSAALASEATAEEKPEGERDTEAKGRLNAAPKAGVRPHAGAGAETRTSQEPVVEARGQQAADRAARAGLDQTAAVGRRPSVDAAPRPQIGTESDGKSAEGTQRPMPAASALNLRTVLKAAVVGLVVVSVVLWLRRKP